ncbi:uncharacterized protein LOC131689426 isoform X1 [Topomyia yanbarensis]|uniref:uncharacterized protein LOC131689426 isoform X1 n=1 Tax=Topomyia yanbarensis TaxID=2498891 RepID=UPI00273C3209|nr:uncharacterized protein LOC131689426 isoform X1 [Topomyia yanbarensis]
METKCDMESGGSDTASTSSVTFQIHNLETVVEESEDANKAISDLNVGLLVEDSTKSELSKYLASLLQRFIQQYQSELEINQFDLLLVTIYCISLEAGFIPWNHQIEDNGKDFRSRYPSYDRRIVRLFSAIVPNNFYNRSNRSYRLNLYLQGSDERCVLVGIRSGDFLCLTFSVPRRTDICGKSVLLPVARYVPLLNYQKLSLSCQNLKELSHKLKNNIFIPVRDALCVDANVTMYPSLNGLPDEVVAMLLVKYLDKKATLRLAASCSRLRMLAMAYRGKWFA